MKDLAAAMDDTGFRTDFGGATALPSPDASVRGRTPAAAAPPAAAAARRRIGPRGVWSGAVAFALVAHAGFFAVTALNRVQTRLDEAVPPVQVYLDLTPRPAPRRSAPAAEPRAETAPRPEAPPPPRPLPFTPRPSQAVVPPPPSVTPPPVQAAAPPAPAPAAQAANPAPAAEPAARSTPSPEFQRRVLAALEKVRRYPPAARARREEGVVVLSFTLNRAGKVLGVSVQASSGSPTLDRAALETVRRASLPRVPEEFADPLRLTVPVEFSLN